MKLRRLKEESGFTLIELLIVMVMTAFFTSLIMFFTFSYWRYGYSIAADLDTFVTRLNAGDVLREVVGTSTGFITQNSIADPRANNPESVGSGYWTVQHAIPGNTPVGATGTTTPLLYFRRFSLTTTGAYILNGAQPYEDEYVLYLNGTTKQLLLRSIANPSATGNRLKSSCPKAVASSSCPEDKIVADNIVSVDKRFFSRSGNLVDWTSVYDATTSTYVGPDYSVVEVLELTLNISKKAVFQTANTTQSSTIIRIALRNT